MMLRIPLLNLLWFRVVIILGRGKQMYLRFFSNLIFLTICFKRLFSAGQYVVTTTGSVPFNNRTINCSPFSVSNTNSAQDLTKSAICGIFGFSGATLYISDCASSGGTCNGDTFLRLYVGGVQVAANDDIPNNACGYCSAITYTIPFNLSNPNPAIELIEGCFDSKSW